MTKPSEKLVEFPQASGPRRVDRCAAHRGAANAGHGDRGGG